jgi:hypothetical protein
MKTRFLFLIVYFAGINVYSQCHYIPSTSTTMDTVIYTFTGGTFASYGCLPIDPTFWLNGYGNAVTVEFLNPQDYPVFRVWGMNDDDSAAVSIGADNYPMNYSSAIYEPKVVCGVSPGPDGIIFANGRIVGANSNMLGNYSYQDVQLFLTGVNAFTVTGVSGAGWGFAGVLVECPVFTALSEHPSQNIRIIPNPFHTMATVHFGAPVANAEVCIYDMHGKLLKKISQITGDRLELEKDDLQTGIYFMTLSQGNNPMNVEKLMVLE